MKYRVNTVLRVIRGISDFGVSIKELKISSGIDESNLRIIIKDLEKFGFLEVRLRNNKQFVFLCDLGTFFISVFGNKLYFNGEIRVVYKFLNALRYTNTVKGLSEFLNLKNNGYIYLIIDNFSRFGLLTKNKVNKGYIIGLTKKGEKLLKELNYLEKI